MDILGEGMGPSAWQIINDAARGPINEFYQAVFWGLDLELVDDFTTFWFEKSVPGFFELMPDWGKGLYNNKGTT
ncbi:MAG: hypothetical protein NPIRA03_06880 [Nitrospirales bacterium]|nr:MAG: hypothetical protein NPIRA03_06880 [Nitrospirales bacterium]